VPTLCQRLFLVVVMLLSLARPAAAADAVAAAVPGERFVAMAPCRLLDTRLDAPASLADVSLRNIDVRATRCGRIVPTFATAYAIRRRAYPSVSGNAPDIRAKEPLQSHSRKNELRAIGDHRSDRCRSIGSTPARPERGFSVEATVKALNKIAKKNQKRWGYLVTVTYVKGEEPANQ
jgi:hypothetical protein